MFLWNMLAYLSIAAFVGIVAFLIFMRFRKNIYQHVYQEDECFKETKENGTRSQICAPKGETLKYIKRYALRKSSYDTSVILSFKEEYEEVSYYIICYNKRHMPIECIQGEEFKTGITSKIINITKKTFDVNVVIKSVNNREINKSILKPMLKYKMRLFSFLASLAFFALFFAIRHFAILIFAQNKAKFFLNSTWNYFGILGILVFAILNYFITMLAMRKRAMKARNGGSLEYEFL